MASTFCRNENCLTVMTDEANTSTTSYDGTRVTKPKKTEIWINTETKRKYLKRTTNRGTSLSSSRFHVASHRTLSRDPSSSGTMPQNMATQLVLSNPGVIPSRSSQKGLLLLRSHISSSLQYSAGSNLKICLLREGAFPK